MLVLLPPSETKATAARGVPMSWSKLAHADLTGARQQVAAALAEASARPDAPDVLGVSGTLQHEIARNLELLTAPALRASRLYTGVLYDALGWTTMSAVERTRAQDRLLVVSALYGLVRLSDRVAPYRLSMSVNLPGTGPLATFWRPHLDATLGDAHGLVVDCRSRTYVAAWRPTGRAADRWVQITVPGATHMAKNTRGLVARALCGPGRAPGSPARLAERLATEFEVSLSAPARPGRPWDLAVTAR